MLYRNSLFKKIPQIKYLDFLPENFLLTKIGPAKTCLTSSERADQKMKLHCYCKNRKQQI